MQIHHGRVRVWRCCPSLYHWIKTVVWPPGRADQLFMAWCKCGGRVHFSTSCVPCASLALNSLCDLSVVLYGDDSVSQYLISCIFHCSLKRERSWEHPYKVNYELPITTTHSEHKRKRNLTWLSVEFYQRLGCSIKSVSSKSLRKVNDIHDIQSCPFDLCFDLTLPFSWRS